MSTVQRVAKNTGIVIIGDVIFKIISLIVIIYLARYLGIASFGKYNFVFAYLAFFSVITDLGVQQILVREMSRDESIAPKLIGNAFIIRLILTVLAFVLSIVLITVMSCPADTTTYVYIAASTLFFISFSDFYSTIFQANLRMEYRIFGDLCFKVLSAILIFWIIFSHGTLMQVMLILVFSQMIRTIVCYLFSRKFVKPRFVMDFGLMRHLFKEALPIAFYSIIHVIYFRIDVIMLSLMQGDVSVGIYSAAYKLSETFSLIPIALMMSLFPIMSAAFKSSEERLIKSYKLAVRYLLIISLPIAIGTTILADKIIFLIYGAEFAGSVTALQILIWALLFTSINSVLLNLLISMDKQRLNTVSIMLCAVVNIILNFVLIPILSYNGASITTVATNIVLFIACFYFVSKYLQVLHIHKIVIKPLIGSLVMGAFIYYSIELNIFLLALLAVGTYLVALIMFKEIQKEDVDILKRIVSRR